MCSEVMIGIHITNSVKTNSSVKSSFTWIGRIRSRYTESRLLDLYFRRMFSFDTAHPTMVIGPISVEEAIQSHHGYWDYHLPVGYYQ